MPSIVKRISRLVGLIAIVAISMMTAGSRRSSFTTKDKAYYADASVIEFIRPGLTLQMVGATVAADGSLTATVSIADAQGQPLDMTGATTPGAVTMSCTMAALPANSNDFVSYTGLGPSTVWFDQGGSWAPTSVNGQYAYSFKNKAPSGFDITTTHRAGCNSSRDLTSFGLSVYYSAATLDFTPGSKTPPTHIHDVVRTAACNGCHATLAYHGGEAQGADLCVLCHVTNAADSTNGNSLYFPVLMHKVHMGSSLPSVKAGKPYQFYAYGGAVVDFSTNAFPPDAGQCHMCHDAKYGATQASLYQTPTRAACGACHDDVNFATAANHPTIELDDTQCANCHPPTGTLPFDTSISGAHISTSALNPDTMSFIPGMIFGNLQVKNGTAGNKPTVTFTLKDKAGNPISLAELAVSPGRIAATLAGPTSDYGYTSFGADVTTTRGYVTETVTNGGTCDGSGNCTYTFTHAIPANAKGSYSIELEGRRALTILPGTTKQVNTEYGAHNAVVSFPVDGSTLVPRRTVVSLEKCNACHNYLSLHGTNRDRIEACVICHNPSETDATTRAQSTDPVQKAMPPQSVNFAYMIHHIHGGADVLAYTGAGYSVIGFGGSFNDFSHVKYPVMRTNGQTGNLGNCEMCHVNGSEQNLPEGLNAVTIPQSKVNPEQATTAACTACHATSTALSHAVANTTILGESCSVCHGANGDFAVSKMHAQ
ncbi:MAG TPA: OmcA/MtrC family decaheme c-type cytochrome [Bryobacteraceae bacterium]|nr:OmcA/MtrC family decaheme c-type cytochrome [Bryobacteraceae bacterium]